MIEQVKQLLEQLGTPRHPAGRCRLLQRRARAALPRGTDPAPHRAPSRSALSALVERLSEPAPIAQSADLVECMLHRLKTPAGRALYGLRKLSVEPVFGILKQAMRFRQFLLRGKAKVSGEWQLVSLAYNLKRMQSLAAA